MKIPRHYILGAAVVGLVAALISMVLSQAGHEPLVSAVRTAASTFGVTTTLALLIAGLWPSRSAS
ncbi:MULTISPECIES: hypothetical protein [unclassified Streptomyces]|uniref:hypothetical protein n=1 Tax=unclassified Streptomyces TaxID=2593676 RepID=UPI000DC7B06E|nr:MULTISPECIES: hypothetical protein [unclassified Streptomyces]AWZ07463.1 hypothetical protein DRB89_25875 [Streptomyces sp. ICC4]AWZ15220.1 hypothetical protein DRB96_26530 [Streptomyces sp. ICC1]